MADDECIEGGKTVAQWLFDIDIYDNMSLTQRPTERVERCASSTDNSSSVLADQNVSFHLFPQRYGTAQAHAAHDARFRWRGLPQ